jgi:tetratricopeptide (TPR) repeat protein/predicted Ser/Thr protein kinase
MLGTLLNNRYHLEAQLGKGGMGVVYRAYDTLLERTVAVKILGTEGLGTEGRARLLREARAAAQLNHPNIVGIYDAGEAAGKSFIVMELVEGASLHDSRPETLGEILRIAGQVCAALEHAHANGIIHRDLKPENILIATNGTAKLSDFGLARSLASRLTSEGSIVGTVFYLAPELAMGEPADGRADLYALGVMLYELCTGQLPFAADDPLAVISQHLYAPVVPPRAIQPNLPAALDALIMRLLAKRPEDRPATAAQVRAALGEIAAGREPELVAPVGLDRLARGRLVGREHELAEVLAHWRQAMEGKGHILLISGEPGIGKTRLARELVAQCRVNKATVLLGECYSEGSGPYGPLAQTVREALQTPLLELPDFVLAELIALAPELRMRYPNVPANPPLEPAAEQQRLFESVVALCSVLAARAPLLIVLDDIHWADSGTMFLLRHLARRTRQERLLIILTYRETELDRSCCLPDVLLDLQREQLAARLKLCRFDRDHTGDLLQTMLTPAGEVDLQLVDAVHRETEGNPFFIEEVCKALVEEDKLVLEQGRWRTQPGVEIVIPQSVRLTVQSRVAKLSTEAQDALRLAAVLGREFDFETLARASALDEDTLITVLEEAQRAQLVEETHRGSRVTFLFAHALIPTTLRDGISGLRRQRLHRRALEAIGALHPMDFATLAYHAEQAGDGEKALAYYHQAGARDLEVYANREAERHYRAALETLGEGVAAGAAEQAALLTGLGEALYREGRHSEAVHTWQEAIALLRSAGEGEALAQLYARTARAAWFAGEWTQALALCQEGLAATADQPPSAGRAALLHEAGRAYFFKEQYQEAQQLCQEALAMAERLGTVEVQAETLSTLGLFPDQPPEQALQYQLRAAELAESAGLLSAASRAHTNLGGAFSRQLDGFSQAQFHHQRAYELAQQIGLRGLEAHALFALTAMFLRAAEMDMVEKNLPRLQQALAEVEPGVLNPYISDMLQAIALQVRGEGAAAIERFEDLYSKAHQQEDGESMATALHSLAAIYIESGDWDRAEEALTRFGSVPNPSAGWNVFVSAAWVALYSQQGRLQEAREMLAQAESSVDPRTPQAETEALQARAAVARAEGRYGDALDALEQAKTSLMRLRMRWNQALVLREQAAIHLARDEAGDRTRARELLQEALGLLEEIGATGYVEGVRELLREEGN